MASTRLECMEWNLGRRGVLQRAVSHVTVVLSHCDSPLHVLYASIPFPAKGLTVGVGKCH
jgi:hypothetical protein